MFIGSLPVASNRATFTQDFQLYDDEDDTGASLAAATIAVEVRRPGTGTVLLSATNGCGITITDADDGAFALRFGVEQMRALCAGTYDCGITVTQNGETTQLFIGTLPVMDGIAGQ